MGRVQHPDRREAPDGRTLGFGRRPQALLVRQVDLVGHVHHVLKRLPAGGSAASGPHSGALVGGAHESRGLFEPSCLVM